jgi:ribosome recycling factor
VAEDRNKLQKEYNDLVEEGRQRVRNLSEAQQETLRITEKIFQISGGQLDLFEKKVDLFDEYNKKQKESSKEQQKVQKATKTTFDKIGESVRKADEAFKDSSNSILNFLKIQNPLDGISSKFGEVKQKAGGIGSKLKGAGMKTKLLAGGAAAAGLGFGLVLAAAKKIFDTIVAVDSATAALVKTTGILDASFSTTLIRATENADLLGGNVQRAGEFAASLISNLSPAISLTGDLVGNVAQVGERFGLSVDNAGKLTQIVSELTNTTFEEASGQVEGIVDGLGRLGPAVARNLADSYDSVVDSFGIGLDSLVEQTRQATRLGIELSKAGDVSEKLLDFQSSISAEFKASALIGQQINLQKARQLAFEGDIVGATNAVLDQVEKLGGLEELNTFQRKALAEAAGLTVSELQKELNLRKQIGTQERITQATRDSALGQIELLQRKLQGKLFEVFASEDVQKAFDNVIEKITEFIDSGNFERLVQKLGDGIDTLGQLLSGERELSIIKGLRGKGFTKEVDDAVITPQGEVVKTNPRDFIIATQNPQELTSGGNDAMMSEMVSLLRDLKQNGVRSEVNLDGKKVSKQLASSNRY